jgi:hypothetical protein
LSPSSPGSCSRARPRWGCASQTNVVIAIEDEFQRAFARKKLAAGRSAG